MCIFASETKTLIKMEELNKNLKGLIAQGAEFEISTITVSHEGRAASAEIITYKRPPGRESDFVAFCKEFQQQYNEVSKNAAIASIEQEIQAEKEAERIREKKRIAEAEQAEKLRKEAEENLKAQYEAELEAERAKLEEYEQAKGGRKNKATKGVVWASLVLLLGMSLVTLGMNYHNLGVLYGDIINKIYLSTFAFVLAFIPAIFAWLKDKEKVEASTYILPIDFAITVLLFVFCDSNSPLVQNWQWLAKNLHFVLMSFSLLGVGFYAYQVYLIYNKLLAIIGEEKYQDFFNKIFE